MEEVAGSVPAVGSTHFGVWESLVNPPASGAGERAFDSHHADHHHLRMAQLEARVLGEHEAAGSGPATETIHQLEEMPHGYRNEARGSRPCA